MAINSVQSSSFVGMDPVSFVGRSLPVTVSYVDKFNNDHFSVTLCQNSKKLARLINDLNALCAVLKGTEPEKFAPKKPCAALYSTDDVWYRAEMLAHYPESKTVVVNFVDFGNTEMVPEKEVLPLTAPFLQFPVQAIRCRFYNAPIITVATTAAESTGTGNFPASTKNSPSKKPFRLYDILYEKLTLKFLSIDHENVFLVDSVGPVVKMNDDIQIPEPLPPIPVPVPAIPVPVPLKNGPIANGYRLNNGYSSAGNSTNSAQNGHVFGQNGQNFVQSHVTSNGSGIQTGNDDKRNGILQKSALFRNSTDSAIAKNVQNPAVAPPTALNPLTNDCLPNKHVKKRRSPPSTSKILGCRSKTVVKIDGLKDLVISACRGGYLDVCLAYLESTDKFYVHMLQHGDKVERLTGKLTRFCAELYKQKSLNRLKPTDCRLGLLCTAYHHHHMDSTKVAFYRCIIIDCSELTDSNEPKIKAYFVDYGFTEELPVHYIFELNDLYKRLPPYAIECSLKDVPSNKRANAQFLDIVKNYTNLCVRLEGVNSMGTGFLVTLFDDCCSNLSIYIAMPKMYEPLKVRVAHPI